MSNPIPAQAANRPSEVNRLVMCSKYPDCLTICLRNGWPGFSCSECRDYEFEHPDDPDHWVEQGKNSEWLLINAGYCPKWIINKARNRNAPEDLFCDAVI